jgi:apolipoprotein N-acyltransferase
VSGPAELLRQIPAEFTLPAAIIIGSIILVSLVLFHGMGVHWVSKIHKRGELRLRVGRPHVFAALILFGTAIFLLLSLHIIGVIWWAVVLRRLGLIHTAKDAIYFCANAYTTLGYGQVDLDPQYRIISPIIGISGLFTFAWTTSMLVNIVRDHNALLETLELERAKEKELRRNLKVAIGSALTQERKAERAANASIEQESAGASLRRHWQLWREERQKLKAIREGFCAEAKGLIHQEQAAENKLGSPSPEASQPAPKQNPPQKP